jgi:hypothetical protein
MTDGGTRIPADEASSHLRDAGYVVECSERTILARTTPYAWPYTLRANERGFSLRSVERLVNLAAYFRGRNIRD